MIKKHLTPLLAAALLALPVSLVAEDAEDNLKQFENFGWFVAEGAQRLELSAAEKEAFLKGVNKALDGDQGPADQRKAYMESMQYMQTRYAELQAKAAKEYFDKLAADPKVKQSPTGLYYEIIKEGESERAGPEDTVKVHYEGALVDGTVFDSSLKRGQPVSFPVKGVVKGFGEGVQLIGPGGKVKLYIPSNLGYGPNPPPGSNIPPDSTLVFTVEMIDINPEPES